MINCNCDYKAKIKYGSGVFIFEKTTSSVFILKRTLPYKNSIISDNNTFIEQYSLPRGKYLSKNEPTLICGIREFMEECGVFFKKFEIFPKTFKLWWHDPINIHWEYEISIIIVYINDIFTFNESYCSSLLNIIRTELNNYYPLLKYNDDFKVINYYKSKKCISLDLNKIIKNGYLKNVKFQNHDNIFKIINKNNKSTSSTHARVFENIEAYLVKIKIYFILIRKQLKLYHSSNYIEFLNFISKKIWVNIKPQNKPASHWEV
ncbi:ADP-pyrophosphatase-like protein [Glossina pallidipes salivary gland hypertrophy virus]|uniref:ADP-pyrophosphatase-like protein n=1 Tax=Glossina hytrovirus (isolate Glossina pallidipes/Ethiopia/Seibersdorf/-) TaxID=379529 RepID=A0A109QTD8_GHVS|nr:ADP-pyrophosphatase-like protein [Glossina pallidipes salivary gland hypertrophy virus]